MAYGAIRKLMLSQLRLDLLGKDSYRGISLTYAWLANQFGHFGLGFIPALFLHLAIQRFFPNINDALLLGCFLSAGVWFGFELFNILWQFSQSKSKKSAFRPDYRNVIEDTSVDVLFFIYGAMAYGLVMDSRLFFITAMIVLTLVLLFFSVRWYRIRVYQQHGNFPFQRRLSQLDTSFSKQDIEAINNYMSEEATGKHLLIFGEFEKGKTSLGVAIANEKAIKNKTTYYTTAIKLYSLLDLDNSYQNLPWNWRSAQYTIIDDINPDAHKDVELIDAKTFMALYSEGKLGAENLEVLSKKNFIWIHGTSQKKSLQRHADWKNALIHAGVNQEKIYSVILV